MPVIEFKLPKSLIREINIFAALEDIDVNTFAVWALAEKLGELKARLMDNFLQKRRDPEEELVQEIPAITEVIPKENSIVFVKFSNGLEGDFDMAGLIDRGGAFSALANPDKFNAVTIAEWGYAIQWEAENEEEPISLTARVIYERIQRLNSNQDE